jgi:hypothetical protein
MDSSTRQARFAGLLYLLSGVTAPFALFYVPGALVVTGDPTATADHVRASETLLRLGIGGELLSATMFVFVVLALYRLLKGVDRGHARAMVILFALSVPISYLNALNDIAALFLVRGGAFLSGFDQRQLDTLALLLPHFAALISRIAFPFLFGEVAIILWLLVVGARSQPPAAQSA